MRPEIKPVIPSGMTLSQQGLDFIARHEGLRLEPYQDVGGKWTVGYGHLLKPEELRGPITLDTAKLFLHNDSTDAVAAVRIQVPRHADGRPLSQYEFDALVDFTFNLGAHNLTISRLREHILKGWMVYESLWTGWDHVHNTELSDLKRRRLDEFRLYSLGEYD